MAEKTADRRTLKTKKALRDALAELLTEKQLHKVTVQEIADKADVNRVTFYKHYLDVYDLYDKIEDETLVELGMLVLGLEEQSEEQFFLHLTDYISDNLMIFRMIFSPNATGQLRSKLAKLIEGVFAKIQSERTGRDITDPEISLLCCYHAQGILAVISRWVQDGCKEQKSFIVKTISAVDVNTKKLFDALAAAKGKGGKR